MVSTPLHGAVWRGVRPLRRARRERDTCLYRRNSARQREVPALEQDRSACFLRQREHKAVAKVQLCGVARALAKVAVSLAGELGLRRRHRSDGDPSRALPWTS